MASRRAKRRIWHPLLAAAARPASAHIAHVLCALNRRRIRCRQSEGWLRHYRTPTRPGIRAGCGSLAALAGHRLMVTADPRPLVGSIRVAVARKCSRSFGYQQAAQFVKAPDLLGLGEQEPVIIYRNRVVTASTSPRPACRGSGRRRWPSWPSAAATHAGDPGPRNRRQARNRRCGPGRWPTPEWPAG
jgi:hypothetical protein